MKIDKFSKAMLVLIALLLALNLRSNLNAVEAAQPPAQYAVFDSGGELYAASKELKERAASGWEYAGSVGNIMIFKK